MRLLKLIGTATAMLAVAAIMIYANTTQTSEAAANPGENPAPTAPQDSDNVYRMGTATVALDSLPVPDEDCARDRQYRVKVKQSWALNFPPEASETRVFNPGDEWANEITVDRLDPGGHYRFVIVAICKDAAGDRVSAKSQTGNIFPPGYVALGGWFDASNNSDTGLLDLHIHPATICDHGYLFSYRVNGSDPWTQTRHLQSASTPQSEINSNFIKFSVDNVDPPYRRARAECVYDREVVDGEETLSVANMSDNILVE